MAAATAPVVPDETVVTAAAAAADDQMIEVWRPAGRSDHKPRHTRRPPRREAQPHVAPEHAAGATEQANTAAAPAERQQQGGERRQFRPHDDKQDERQQRHDRQQKQQWQQKRDERTSRSGGDRKFSKSGRRDRGDTVERAERDLYYAKPGVRIRQSKEADPNSPFAKLAALKQQLEDGAKERR